MACRDALKAKKANLEKTTILETKKETPKSHYKLLFGVDSKTQAFDLLQNNIDLFDWVVRNKIHPDFWGRNINGQNSLTKEEINFIHNKGCKIAPIYVAYDETKTSEHGSIIAKKALIAAMELGIPKNSAIFLEIFDDKAITSDCMLSYASAIANDGYIPAFKANTDAKYNFDREYSRCLREYSELFKNSLVWATSPTLPDYEGMTTSHLIYPDIWKPFAPSGITRNDIAIWQYGKDCHPINNDSDVATSFNLNLVINDQIIIKKMF